ncbi:MAG TPA: AMP-binding protein [Acetobacteraceae bacterium]|nr:AMP-binding protein [Acetobacteraceae bacterium]
MALTIPALLAERIAAHGNQTVLRKKYRGIWQAETWSQLGTHVREIAKGLASISFEQGDVACVLAETRPDCVYIDLGIIEAGGVSGAINPATEPDALGDMLQQANCRVLFVENEEQLDKALAVRDRCRTLKHIIVLDMKGLRDFADPMCQSLQRFVASDSAPVSRTITEDKPAVLLFPQLRVLTHGDALHMVAHARSLLKPIAGDERLALLPMCHAMERVLGLYLSLEVRAISNYLESPDTVIENLQEVQPTLLGADPAIWQLLYLRATTAAKAATPLQRSLYRWAIGSGGALLARVGVLGAVRRELGLSRLRRAYIGSAPLPLEIEQWARALGVTIQQIDGQATHGISVDARYRALMEEAYGT